MKIMALAVLMMMLLAHQQRPLQAASLVPNSTANVDAQTLQAPNGAVVVAVDAHDVVVDDDVVEMQKQQSATRSLKSSGAFVTTQKSSGEPRAASDAKTTTTTATLSSTNSPADKQTESQNDETLDASTMLADYDREPQNQRHDSASSTSKIALAHTSTTFAPLVGTQRQSDESAEQPQQAPSKLQQRPAAARLLDTQRRLRDDMIGRDGVEGLNVSAIYQTLFKKRPFSKFWTAEQKWDDMFKRLMAMQGTMRKYLAKTFMRDIEYYADVAISQKCADDLRFVQEYAHSSTNFRWLLHMIDATGKSEPGMLTGNMANLGHVVQCIRVRAPSRPSNDTFQERFFEQQTRELGERFRGKYCLASVRPVMPQKPRIVSRFSQVLNSSSLSNISYTGLSSAELKQLAQMTYIDEDDKRSIDKQHTRLDQVPFESELYEYLINQRNFMYALPRFMGVCYPSSCTRDDIKFSIQKSLDEQHQVVDVEFDCEEEEKGDSWAWFTTARLLAYVALFLVAALSLCASVARYIIVSKFRITRNKLAASSPMVRVLDTLDLLSMDKCAGVLFVKTRTASPYVDVSKLENTRSTSIDALKGFLMLVLVYNGLVHLGCLPVPFMWSKWGDAMFPFFRSFATQPFLNTFVWSDSFYFISAYIIALKFLELARPQCDEDGKIKNGKMLDFGTYLVSRYIRLVVPMFALILFNYVWPRLAYGFVMHDQAKKLLEPCDNYGWTNMLLFHNRHELRETCLWPTHVSASFFQLHLLSYPLLVMFVYALRTQLDATMGARRLLHLAATCSALFWTCALALVGLLYSAYVASREQLIVPFLIDYIDYDNYRRVLEYMIIPTHNHLASYMAGILLAFYVVYKRASREQAQLEWSSFEHEHGDVSRRVQSAFTSKTRQANSNNFQKKSKQPFGRGHYIQRHQSVESVSSSTRELDLAGNSSRTPTPSAMMMAHTPASICGSASLNDDDSASTQCCCGLWPEVKSFAQSGLVVLVAISATSASYFWNALGQPMSPAQTFWYLVLSKLVFTLAFAHLFHKHFALRRNAIRPWMVTRFLVPIGRMSLMVFYVSWPVIWFDLLASLYQWHPSHYFVVEKFTEIMFMTLIIAIFAYGAFEGPIKIIAYKIKGARKQRIDRFDDIFMASEPEQHEEDEAEIIGKTAHSSKLGSVLGRSAQAQTDALPSQQQQQRHITKSTLAAPARGLQQRPSVLNIAHQYELNAELRANYSFASIGLYQSAGATDELEPQPSPRPTSNAPQRN